MTDNNQERYISEGDAIGWLPDDGEEEFEEPRPDTRLVCGRKDYRCASCGGEIPKGTRHRHEFFTLDRIAIRTHLHCPATV